MVALPKVALTAAQAALARTSPALFMSVALSGWVPYTWLQVVDYQVVQAITNPDRRKRKICISAPPQHGKSLYSSIGLPAWSTCRYPGRRHLLAFHTAPIANTMAAQCRKLVAQYGHVVGRAHIDYGVAAAKNIFRTTEGGGMETVGIGGGISGKTADGVIFDDPFPNWKRAQSKTYREEAWNFFANDLMPRRSNEAWVVVLQTHWNTDDIIGRIKRGLAGDPEDWTFVNLPARAEEVETLPSGKAFRQIGDPLCPELKSADFLDEIKEAMPAMAYEGLYQQRPRSPVGQVFDDSNFPRRIWVQGWPAAMTHMVVGIDPSLGKDAKGDDWQAAVAIGFALGFSDRFYCDARMLRTTKDAMIDNLVGWMSQLPVQPTLVYGEGVGFQRYVINDLRDAINATGWGHDCLTKSFEPDITLRKLLRIRLAIEDDIVDQVYAWIRSEGSLICVDQIKTLGVAKSHDDGPDALHIARKALSQLHLMLESVE